MQVAKIDRCILTAGTDGHQRKVVAPGTENFLRIHRRYLARLPGVAKLRSSFALRTVCKTTALPLQACGHRRNILTIPNSGIIAKRIADEL